jgi:serine/threonine protein kinase
MSMIRLECPRCGAPLKTRQAIPTGRKILCPRCQHQFVAVPGGETSPADGNRETIDQPGPPPEPPLAAPPRPAIPGYVILSELGSGGMGIVYKARQTSLNRLVALKLIRAGATAQAEEVGRFRAEATALAQAQHPHIVQIYEVGQHAGQHFLSLEFVNGPTLAGRLAGTPQPCRPAAGLVEMLARAVAVAHQRGIIHRDLKPQNVLLAVAEAGSGAQPRTQAHELYGIPKITDFGLAKRFDAAAEEASHTRTGCIVGTPAYMAPEQAEGRPGALGPATDVYALGVILYEMLTGRPPFQGANALETMQQLMAQDPVPPRRLQAFVPRDLETICLKCLQKDPRKRYASALALAEDLRRYLAGEPIQARPAGPAERLWRWCLRYPVPASLLAGTVCCLVFGCWYLAHVTEHLVRSAALESAAQQSDILREVNDIYSDVVKRAKAGNLTVTHDYGSNPAAIPIPATFTIELGQQISDRSETGMQIRLYSDYPFRSRRGGGPKDAFERDALERLRADPNTPVYEFGDYKGRPVLRYATARLMQATCVECHNTHPDSPKTDWHVGELRGVVEIIRPLDQDATRTRQGLQGAFLLIGVVCASLLGLSGLALFVGRLKQRRGEMAG